ncbi:MAG: hypothetical protein KA749_00735 [Acidovorax sp.]|nr:hypothetical protein [Acidovorax sp.]
MGIATYPSKLGQTAKQPSARQAQSARASVLHQYASVLRNALPVELKAHGAELPMAEIDAMADALARQIAELVDTSAVSKPRKAQALAQEEWITTQEAANRSGFSRPFVAALLDSGAYKGRVNRTAGGHRKVLASEFEALMAKASAEAPKTLAQARKAVDLTPQQDNVQGVPLTERKRSRARAQALAKKLGINA